MSITHCPLCVGLAVLSAVRFMAHALMVWQWLAPRHQARVAVSAPPAWQSEGAAGCGV